ncbi:MAG: MFS transporter [Candidatus Nanopelagicales bacterium]|jgi:MFS family permease|nr:MFS transporter [Candidatus Nanopelagicales bacterium]MCU0299510.1 MFS transporter [Candidatus Nanopelagicales bacterium]
MSDTQPAVTALEEPTRSVHGAFLATMALANLGIMLAFFAPLQNLLPRMSEQIAGADGKETALAVVTGIGVIGSVIGNPLAGALSDRTTSRFGRRRPWMLGGSLLGFVGLVLMPNMTSIFTLTLVWLAVQFAVNAAYAGLTATIPDQVPVRQRGVASGLVGLAQALGPVVGVGLVSFVVVSLTGGSYLTAVLFVLLVLPIIFVLKDPQLPEDQKPPFALGAFIKSFWVSPKAHPDFGWAWLARFLVSLSIAMATIYLLFFLTDHLGFDDEAAGQRQTVLLALYAGGTMITSVIGGYVSDRMGKRKMFVIIASFIIALAGFILAFVPEGQGGWGITMIAALILGIGYGWYLAVDQALITQVLPTAGDRAKDLGVINIANSMPQVLAPVMAAVLVTQLGGYTSLFLAVAIITIAGAIAIVPIKSVP